MNNELGSVTFERIFESQDEKGNLGSITLRIGNPFLIEASNSSLRWHCLFQLIGIGRENVATAPGIDAIDAMLVSLRIAEVLLKSYSRAQATKITWLGEEWLGLSLSPIAEISDQDIFEANGFPFDQMFEDFFLNFLRKSTD
jgi:hypothetical protein